MTSEMLCRNIFVLFTCLLKVAEIQAQCTKPYVGENRVLIDTDIVKDTFPDGSTATFKCSTGYQTAYPPASRTITCSGNQWSSLGLQCEKKSCGNPGDITNGRYTFNEGIFFGATITAECNSGYMLLGQKTRNCLAGGWDGRAPTCEVVKCISPPSVNNGYSEDPPEDEYDFGMSITYKCNRDFTLIGEATIHCSENGAFQPEPPKCLIVACDKPSIPNASRVEGKAPPYGYNHFVVYKCDPGYEMFGDSRIVCKETGWQPSPPQCLKTEKPTTPRTTRPLKPTPTSTADPQMITCDKPIILHSETIGVSKPTYRYKEHIRFKCNDGYTMDGADELVCKEHGWDPPPPECSTSTSWWWIVLLVLSFLIILAVALLAVWFLKRKKSKAFSARFSNSSKTPEIKCHHDDDYENASGESKCLKET